MINRSCIIAGVLVSAAAALFAQQATTSTDRVRQEGMTKPLMDALDEDDPRIPRLKEDIRQVETGLLLPPAREHEIQREIENRLKPVPIQNSALAPRLMQDPIGFYRALGPAEQSLLIERTRSVAQIEVQIGDDVVARGTGFVVGTDLIATNCHVLASIASQDISGRWNLRRRPVRAHFSDGPEHDAAREFLVTEVVAYPDTPGLDVAVLRVETTSLDRSATLPPPLPLREQPLNAEWAAETGFPVAVVGYPVVASSTEQNYRELRGYGRFGKVYSPGAVLEVKRQGSVDMLLHVASTTEGNSGSPLLALDGFDVVGIHHCCTAAGILRPAALACSQTSHSPADRNLAIAASQLFGDKQLSQVFSRPAR